MVFSWGVSNTLILPFPSACACVRACAVAAAMFDHLHVQAYGKSTPLSEVGQVTIKSPTLAVINVYDPEVSL